MDAYIDLNNQMKAIENSKIKLVYCRQFDEKSGLWNLEKHNHPFIELMYFLDGNAYIEALSENISISLYNIIIYPKGVFHKETLDMNLHQEIICLGVESEGFELNHTLHLPDNNSKLKWLFENVLNEYARPDRSDEVINHFIKLIFMLAERRYFQKESQKGNSIEMVVQYLHDHFTETITVKELAELIHVSESYLNRSFKKKTKTTPLKYINILRIEAAKHLLRTSDLSIEEVSYKIGFNSPKYFSRIFKLSTGKTASNFRT
jgi:Transcriptional regulator containing an amidase domain and an AraC-type DNA-binding HTH domain